MFLYIPIGFKSDTTISNRTNQNCYEPETSEPEFIEVRGMPNGIFHPWVRWDSGVEVARKFFRRRRRRRRRRPPKVGVW